MPCKGGYRESLEESKRRSQQEKEYDPYRELWTSLVRRVFKTTAGFTGLNSDEKLYYSVCILEGEVYNGGFHQFFSNSSGGYFREAASGLEVLGAYRALELLLRAKDLAFPNGEPPIDWEERRISLRLSESDTRAAALDELDTAFYEDADNLGEKITRFAADRGLVTPFLK